MACCRMRRRFIENLSFCNPALEQNKVPTWQEISLGKQNGGIKGTPDGVVFSEHHSNLGGLGKSEEFLAESLAPAVGTVTGKKANTE